MEDTGKRLILRKPLFSCNFLDWTIFKGNLPIKEILVWAARPISTTQFTTHNDIRFCKLQDVKKVLEAALAEAESSPAETEVSNAKADGTQAEAEAAPAEAKSSPAEAEVSNAEADGTQAEAEVALAEAETSAPEAEASPWKRKCRWRKRKRRYRK